MRSKHSRRSERHEIAEEGFVKYASIVGRVSFLLLVVVVPWKYGSVTWFDQLLLLPFSGFIFLIAAAVALAKRQKLVPGLGWLMAAMIVLACIQVLPLPESVWQALAPGAAFDAQVTELADDFQAMLSESADASVGSLGEFEEPTLPRTFSIHPVQSRASLAVFASAFALFLSARILFANEKWSWYLLAALALTTFCHSMLGLLQRVSAANWTLLPMPGDSYFGTFVSRNTAPQYYAIGIGASLGLLSRWIGFKSDASTEKRYNVRYPAANMLARFRRRLEDLVTDLDLYSTIGIVIIILEFVAVLATASRGGVIACGGAVVVTCIATLGQRSSLTTYALLGTCALFVVLFFLGSLGLDDQLLERMGRTMSEVQGHYNLRYDIWRMALSNSSYYLTGCGLGTFHFGILPMQERDSAWAYHAESIYVETLTEFGWLGGLLLLAILAVTIFHFRSKVKNRASRIAATFALTAVALHSFVDFSLIIPAVFVSMGALIGCFVGQHPLGTPKSSSRIKSTGKSSKNMASDSSSNLSFSQIQFGTATFTLVICGLIVQGAAPLYGLAVGEHLQKLVENNPSVLFEIDDEQVTSSEVALQIARMRQANVEKKIARLPDWPLELEMVRGMLSEADKVAAAIRCPSDSKFGYLKNVYSMQDEVVSSLVESCTESASGIVCAQDWRASWGVFRGDCGQLSVQQRARNLARLALLTNHYSDLQQRIGTVALWSGERSIGLDFWQRSLRQNPLQATKIVDLIGETITEEELRKLVNDDLVSLAMVSKQLLPRFPELSQRITLSIDIQQLNSRAKTSTDWELNAWVANQQGNIQEETHALQRIAELVPLSTAVRYDLARLLESQGRIDEAIVYMKEAIRRGQKNQSYEDYLEQLQQAARTE